MDDNQQPLTFTEKLIAFFLGGPIAILSITCFITPFITCVYDIKKGYLVSAFFDFFFFPYGTLRGIYLLFIYYL